MKQESIAAIATPVAEGSIGVIRISGDDAIEILEKVFFSVRKHIEEAKPKFSDEIRINVAKDQRMMNIAAEKAGIMDDKKWLYEDADLSYELEMEKDPAFQAGLLIGPEWGDTKA